MENKSIKRYETFCKSLANLSRCKMLDPKEDCVIEGTVQRFSLTFDISWKVMKDILIKHKGVLDFATGSPRDTLKTAFSNGLIDSDIWMNMLHVRNQLTHDYDGEYAMENFSKINTDFYDAFERFQNTAQAYYADAE